MPIVLDAKGGRNRPPHIGFYRRVQREVDRDGRSRHEGTKIGHMLRLILVALLAMAGCAEPAAPIPRNVVIVSLDALIVCNLNSDVTVTFDNSISSSLGSSAEASERRCVAYIYDRHSQLIDIGAIVVLSIGDGRFQNLTDEMGGLLLAELKNIQRLPNGLAANLVRDQPAFLRRDTRMTKCGCSFHIDR